MNFTNIRSNLKGLPREIWLLYITTMISRLGTMVLPFLAVYLSSSSFNIDKGRAGFTVAIYGLGALITAPVTGYLCDRFNPLSIIKWGLFLQGLVLLLFPLAVGYHSIIAITFAWALIGESFKPASSAFISTLTDERQRRIAFALNRSAINVGMSIGPALGGVLSHFQPTLLFFANGAAAIISGLFLTISLWSSKDPETKPAHRGGGAQPTYDINVLKDRRMLFLLLAILPALMVFFQYRTALPQYLIEGHGMAKSAYGLLFTINTLLVVFLDPTLNSALQRWPEKFSMSVGALLIGAGFGGFAFSTTFPAAAACAVVWTFGEILLFSSSSTYVSKIAGPHKGKYMGLYHTTVNLATFVGPALGTLLLVQNARLLWGSMFVFGCLSAAMLLALSSPEEAVAPSTL